VRAQPSGTVVHTGKPGDDPGSHEWLTRAWIANRLARLLGYAYAGEFKSTHCYSGPLYFVPGDTLLSEQARVLGIRAENDLFGGVVPYAFLATKAIAHPLIDGGHAPPGWSHGFGAALGDAVLPGYAAFTLEDAHKAGRRLLEHGVARVKAGGGIGGRDQTVVASETQLEAALHALDRQSLAHSGVIIEQNLVKVTTYSVGQVRVGDLLASYAGTQRLTPDPTGAEVYGGSNLTFARGGYARLLALPLAPELRMAVERARAFDQAVSKAYPGLIASRRNYDIAHGLDAGGGTRIGLLEQSWRMGGASAAEIVALEAFRAEPGLRVASACSVELYGDDVAVPATAITYYCGDDARAPQLTKYVLRQDHAIPA
jgi:uncharacterized protein DUF3182